MEIKLNNFTIKNKKNKITILDNATYTFKKNNYYLIEGENGSGKSTILNAICKLSFSDFTMTGSIDYNSNHINPKKTLLSQCAYLSQEDVFVTNKVIDEVSLSAKLYTTKKISKTEIVNTFEKLNLTNLLNKKINKLSGGEKKLVSLLCFLIRSNDALFYILDEPFNNLDANHIDLVSQCICNLLENNKEALVIMVSHLTNNTINNKFKKIKLLNKKLV